MSATIPTTPYSNTYDETGSKRLIKSKVEKINTIDNQDKTRYINRKRNETMNIITAKNGNRLQHSVARDVVKHCIQKLMPRMRTLDINVVFKRIPKKENTVGTCLMQENNRNFELEIEKKLSFDEMVKTLCHEMVHVKQYARNEMTDNAIKGVYRWRNRYIKENTSYSKLPWEREAYRKQKTLAKSYYNSTPN